MTEEIVGKVCGNPSCVHAGERQPLENFHNLRSARDGKQRYCKECNVMKQAKYKKGELTPRSVTKIVKLNKINENLKNGAENVTEAYRALATTSTNNSASVQANKFFSTLGEDLVDKFLDSWKTEGSLSAFDEYFEEARRHGTLTEKRDACVLKAKMLGLMKDRVVDEREGQSKESRDSKLAAIEELLLKGRKEGYESK